MMPTPVSLPLWILLIVAIGAPVHVLVNRGIAHWRRNFEISAVVTMMLVMAVSLVVAPLMQGEGLGWHDLARQLAFSSIAGLLFGAPLGLIARMSLISADAK